MPELTQRMVDAIKPPPAGRIEVRDAKVRGLVLRVSASGAKSWSYEFRSPVTQKMTRASVPVLTLADARADALAKKISVGKGRDPTIDDKIALEVRRAEHANTKSVALAIADYEKDLVIGPKAKSRRERIGKLRRALEIDKYKDRPVASLAKGEIVRRLDEIQAESGPIARNRAHAEIRAWLKWLSDRDHVPSIVIAGVSKKKETARSRVLTDAELAAMMSATTDGLPFSDVVRVLLHTAMRKSEASNLQPRDLHFEARRITVRETVDKTNRERLIPMPEAIAPMLAARANGLKREEYIFGDGSGFASPLSGWGKPTDRLREAMPAGDPWTLHDIRRTVGTRLHDAGVDTLIVEDLLGHMTGQRGGVAGVYNRSVTLEKQAEALSAWAAKLASLANVVTFKRVA